LRLYEKLDLFTLKALGSTTAEAGIYGAAQNLAVIPGIFAMSFTPLVLATISRLSTSGGTEAARKFARHALRVVVLSLGFAAVASGSASEIVRLIYNPEYAPAANVLRALIVGAWGMVVVSTASAILIAYARPNLVLALTLPLMPIALVAHLLVIPHFHATGAACVTTLTAVACALGFVIACGRVCHAAPGVGTCMRSLLIAAAAYATAVEWHASGLMVVVKITALCLAVLISLPLTGELSRPDWTMLASLMPPRRSSTGLQPEAV
jgi:O-antigen/teichoic acid export membrane protein